MAVRVSPVRVQGFAHLALAYGVNELGNWFGEIALAVVVFDATGSALATAALFLAMQVLPSLLGPMLVARVEPVRATQSLPAIYACEAVAFAGLAALASGSNVAAILAIAALDGTLAATARALTRAAAAALLLDRGLLREGNATLNALFTAAAAAGPALGGAVVAGAGAGSALLIDAGSFLGAAALMALAPGLPRPAAGGDSWSARLRSGLDYVRGHATLRALLAAQAAALVFFTAVIPVEVAFAKQSLDAGDFGYGALLASWGAGTVAGAALFARLRRGSLPALAAVGALAVGLAYALTAAAPNLGFACAASVLGGAGNGVEYVAALTAAQEITTGAQQARVAALFDTVTRIAPGPGFALGGAVAALANPRASYAVAAAGIVAVFGLAAPRLARLRWEPLPHPRASRAAAASSRIGMNVPRTPL